MLQRQANRRVSSASQRLVLALAAVAAVAAAGAWWRWERSPELLPGVPRPAWARAVEVTGMAPEHAGDAGDAGESCAIDAFVEGPPREVAGAYAEQLRRRGWSELGGAGVRMRFREGRRRLTMRVATSTTEPGWSRLQVEVTRCRERS